jgi:imidazolonepropionase-like amidohydrolase
LWAAEAVGVGADLGSIEVGKLADLIVVEGDPLANIADSINVVVTLKGGRAYTREALFVPSR